MTCNYPDAFYSLSSALEEGGGKLSEITALLSKAFLTLCSAVGRVMAPTPTMEPLSGEEEWRRMEREHPVMRMTRNDKGKRKFRLLNARVNVDACFN